MWLRGLLLPSSFLLQLVRGHHLRVLVGDAFLRSARRTRLRLRGLLQLCLRRCSTPCPALPWHTQQKFLYISHLSAHPWHLLTFLSGTHSFAVGCVCTCRMVISPQHLSVMRKMLWRHGRPAYSCTAALPTRLSHARLRSSHLLLRLRARMMTFPFAYLRFESPAACYVFSTCAHDELSQSAVLSDRATAHVRMHMSSGCPGWVELPDRTQAATQ